MKPEVRSANGVAGGEYGTSGSTPLEGEAEDPVVGAGGSVLVAVDEESLVHALSASTTATVVSCGTRRKRRMDAQRV